MTPDVPTGFVSETSRGERSGAVTVHYWASARAAAGVAEERIPVTGPLSLAALVEQAAARHPDSRLAEVLAVCAVLVGDRPASAEDRAEVTVAPGDVVEFLPPFAGG